VSQSFLLEILLELGTKVVVVWTLLGFGLSLALTGSPRFCGTFLLIVICVPLAIFVGEVYELRSFVRLAGYAGPWLVCLCGAGGTIFLLVWARRLNLIGSRSLAIACLWLVLAASFVLHEFSPSPRHPWDTLLYLMGLLALPALPIAAAPLALAWNRHR
jgi:hypothetical protein